MLWSRRFTNALLCCALSVAASPRAWASHAGSNDDEKDTKIYVGRPFIVTASRLNEPLDRALKSVTVITADDISRQQALTAAEVLRNAPGLDVQSSGGTYGSAVDVRLRGADTDQVLVLIDGVQVNSTWLGSFNFADLPAENIERIEIVRGPASALYGSEAVGGVINIISKRGPEGFHPSLTVEGGSLGTRRALASLAGGAGALDYSLTLSRLTSDGNGGRDGYGNSSFSGRLGFRASADRTLGFNARYTDGRKEVPYDFQSACDSFWNCTSFQTNDPNNSVDNRFLDLSFRYSDKISDRWYYSIGLGQVNGMMTNVNEADPDPTFVGVDPDTAISYASTVQRSSLDTRRSSAETQHNLELLPWGVLSLGVEAELEEAERTDFSNFPGPDTLFTSVDVDRTNVAYFAQQKLAFGPPESRPRWKEAKEGAFVRVARHLELTGSLAFGVRLDDNSQFGSEVSPKAAGGFEMGRTGTGVALMWSESYNAPSLTDLYFPGFANPDLKPETSSTAELTFKQKLLGHRPGAALAASTSQALQAAVRAARGVGGGPGKDERRGAGLGLTLDISYFKTKYDNLIDYDRSFVTHPRPGNVARAEIEGLEAALSADLSKRAGAVLSYTHLEARKWASADAESRRLQRRPRGLFNLAIWAGPFERVSGRIGVNTTSSAEDNFDFIGADGVLRSGDRPGFTKVDVALSYALTSRHRVHLKVENLFDEDYEEVKGFPAPGRVFLAGVTLSP